MWPEFADLDNNKKKGAKSLRALEIRQKNRNPNECWWWWWMASVDVASVFLLLPPANFGGGGSVVRRFEFFVFLIFILSNWNKKCKRVKFN